MSVPSHRQLLADSLLVMVTLIWGSTFVILRDVVAQVSPFILLSVRLVIASVALALLLTATRRWRGLTWRELRWSSLIGAALWGGYAFQTLGLQYTTASNAGFITGLSAVMVPLLGLVILKRAPDSWSLAGVLFCTAGLAMLVLNIEHGIHINQGDPLVLACAVSVAFQIVLVSHVSGWVDPLRNATIQIATAALLSVLCAFIFERPVVGLKVDIWLAVAYLGIPATALAIGIQTTVQSFTTAVHTALIFTLEPVFAALFGFWLQGDRLGPVGLFGAVLILIGMLTAELGAGLARTLHERRRRTMGGSL
jgi:drug/metabolite transporter (DMT)-like permease